MAVFVSASDETSGQDHRSVFWHGGLIAPETDWSNLFAIAWDKEVLAGPPRIPFLHMTEIRSRAWREKYTLSEADGEQRVERGFLVMERMPVLIPIASRINAGLLSNLMPDKLKVASGANKKLEPDYLAFLGYVFTVLEYVSLEHREAEKVDFVVERKSGVTENMHEFYGSVPKTLEELGLTAQAGLLGELIPSGKERVPLQAADMLCWHSRRALENTLSEIDLNRYMTLAKRNGYRHEWTEENIKKIKIATSMSKEGI